MPHPFLNLTASLRKRLFWLFLGLTIITTIVLQLVDGPLQTLTAPQGIVSYELAGGANMAGRILAEWNANARLHAAFSLGFDYLYMLAYATTLALAALWAAEGLSGWGRRLGALLAWSMGIAGLADATENFFLWRMLVSGPTDAAAATARWAALLKFTLIILLLLYVIFALIVQRVRK